MPGSSLVAFLLLDNQVMMDRNPVKYVSQVNPQSKAVSKRFIKVVQMVDTELKPVAKYFHDNYIGTTWTPPLYDIRLWNVLSRLKNGIPRTSNHAEGWHYRFQNFLENWYPPIWRVMFELLREQHRTENTFARMAVGRYPSRSVKKYKDLTSSLKKTTAKYNKIPFTTFVKSIVYKLP